MTRLRGGLFDDAVDLCTLQEHEPGDIEPGQQNDDSVDACDEVGTRLTLLVHGIERVLMAEMRIEADQIAAIDPNVTLPPLTAAVVSLKVSRSVR